MAAKDCVLMHTPYQDTLSGTAPQVREFTLPLGAWGAVVYAHGANPQDLRVSVNQSLTDNSSTIAASGDYEPVDARGALVVYFGPPEPANATRRKVFVASGTASATAIVKPGGPELLQS